MGTAAIVAAVIAAWTSTAIASGPLVAGEIVVAASKHRAIVRVAPETAEASIFLQDWELIHPWAFAVDPSDDLVFLLPGDWRWDSPRLVRMDGQTHRRTPLAAPDSLFTEGAIAVEDDGDLLAGRSGEAPGILRLSADGSSSELVTETETEPRFIAADGDAIYYSLTVAGQLPNVPQGKEIFRIVGEGNPELFTAFAGELAGFELVDGGGLVAIVELESGFGFRRVDDSGAVVESHDWGPDPEGLFVFDFLLHSSGTLYGTFTHYPSWPYPENTGISKIDPETGIRTPLTIGGERRPVRLGLLAELSDGSLAVLDPGGRDPDKICRGSVWRVDLDRLEYEFWAAPGAFTAIGPLSFAPSGDLYAVRQSFKSRLIRIDAGAEEQTDFGQYIESCSYVSPYATSGRDERQNPMEVGIAGPSLIVAMDDALWVDDVLYGSFHRGYGSRGVLNRIALDDLEVQTLKMALCDVARHPNGMLIAVGGRALEWFDPQHGGRTPIGGFELAPQLYSGSQVAVDSEGIVFVLSRDGLYRFAIETGEQTLLASSEGLGEDLRDLAVDGQDRPIVLDAAAGRITAVDPESLDLQVVAEGPLLEGALYMAVAPPRAPLLRAWVEPRTLSLEERYPTQGLAMAVQAEGDEIFVATHGQGLLIFHPERLPKMLLDASLPVYDLALHPKGCLWAGLLDQGIAVFGVDAWRGYGAGSRQMPMPGLTPGLVASENYLLAVGLDEGLRIFEIQGLVNLIGDSYVCSPENSSWSLDFVTEVETQGRALRPFVEELWSPSPLARFYLPEMEGRLRIFQLDGDEAEELASLAIPETALRVDVQNEFAYVAAGGAGVRVVDVADSQAPSELSHIGLPSGGAEDVAVRVSTVFVAAGSGGLHAIDVGDPANPRWIGSVDTPGFAQDVSLDGSGRIVVADHGSVRRYRLEPGAYLDPTGERPSYLVLSNPGDEAFDYRLLPPPGWIEPERTTGTLAAGQSTRVLLGPGAEGPERIVIRVEAEDEQGAVASLDLPVSLAPEPGGGVLRILALGTLAALARRSRGRESAARRGSEVCGPLAVNGGWCCGCGP